MASYTGVRSVIRIRHARTHARATHYIRECTQAFVHMLGLIRSTPESQTSCTHTHARACLWMYRQVIASRTNEGRMRSRHRRGQTPAGFLLRGRGDQFMCPRICATIFFCAKQDLSLVQILVRARSRAECEHVGEFQTRLGPNFRQF